MHFIKVKLKFNISPRLLKNTCHIIFRLLEQHFNVFTIIFKWIFLVLYDSFNIHVSLKIISIVLFDLSKMLKLAFLPPCTLPCLFFFFLMVTVLDRHIENLLFLLCVSPFLSHYYHTHNTSNTRCVRFSHTHQAVLCDTSQASYNSNLTLTGVSTDPIG